MLDEGGVPMLARSPRPRRRGLRECLYGGLYDRLYGSPATDQRRRLEDGASLEGNGGMERPRGAEPRSLHASDGWTGTTQQQHAGFAERRELAGADHEEAHQRGAIAQRVQAIVEDGHRIGGAGTGAVASILDACARRTHVHPPFTRSFTHARTRSTT